MRARGVVLLVAVVAFASWPTVSGAEDDPATTDTTVPATTDTTVAPPTTALPPTTVPETPSATTVPEPTPTTVPEIEPTSEGATGERTLRVRPHNDLIDGQVVGVQGHDWRPRTYIYGAVQCRAGIPGLTGCSGRPAEARTDARGNFRVEFEVQVILETESGTYDCRVAACTIRAIDPRLEGASRSVRLFFDPEGPDPVREEASISPSTNLVDGQIVTVVGEDFDVSGGYGYAELVECRLPVSDREDDCDDHTESYADIGRDGYVATTFRLEGLLRVEGGDVDCRTNECALFVGEEGEGLARAALVPLDFDPDAPLGPPATVTITPSTGLRDGQIVDVDGEGLPADTFLILADCRWGATEVQACSTEDFNYAKVRADGTFHTQLGVRAVFHADRSGDRVNCRVTACSLTTFGEGPYGFYSPEGFGGDFDRVTRTRLRFRPNAPLLEPSIDTADLAGVRAGSRWRIWGTGGRPEGTVVLIQCAAGARTLGGCAQGTKQNVHSHFEPRDRVGVSWETRYRFQRHLHLSDGRQIDCVVDSCALVAMERGGGLAQSDRILTAFAG